jgi:hypothetical protein
MVFTSLEAFNSRATLPLYLTEFHVDGSGPPKLGFSPVEVLKFVL